MATIKSVFEKLQQSMAEQNQIKDWPGAKELYTKLSNQFLDILRTNKYTVTSSEMGSSYFIFHMGENTILHYRLKECPGWLFGVWWSVPEGASLERVKNGDYIELRGTWFAQYELNIDKFKPSCSQFTANLMVRGNGDVEPIWVLPIIKFIRDYPALAFCRDYFGWDYNECYHSRLHAWYEWKKFEYEHQNYIKHKTILWRKWLKLCRKVIGDDKDNVYYLDRGSNWSPRYVLIAIDKEVVDNNINPVYCDLNSVEPYATPYKKGLKKLEKLALKWNISLYTSSIVTFYGDLSDSSNIYKL